LPTPPSPNLNHSSLNTGRADHPWSADRTTQNRPPAGRTIPGPPIEPLNTPSLRHVCFPQPRERSLRAPIGIGAQMRTPALNSVYPIIQLGGLGDVAPT